MICFFFQAEDVIRDYKVTGVQTCALPIWASKSLTASCSVERTSSIFMPIMSMVILRGRWVSGSIQIGRASCRGEWESWGGGGGFDDKREEDDRCVRRRQ